MQSRIFLNAALVITVGMLPACDSPKRSETSFARPNVILFLVDDLGFTDHSLEPTGSRIYETPNLERLRAEGMLFTNAYAAHPNCSPTRASILTGKYPARLGLTWTVGNDKPWLTEDVPAVTEPGIGTPSKWNHFAKTLQAESRRFLPLSEFTIAEAMQDLQKPYTTAFIGKWHLGDDRHSPRHQGFKHVGTVVGAGPARAGGHFIPALRPVDRMIASDFAQRKERTLEWTNEAVEFLRRQRDAEQPFMLFLWHFDVHGHWQARSDRVLYYRNKIARNAIDENQSANGHTNPVYASMVERVDRSLGMILDLLDSDEFAEMKKNTVVIFTSDNGAATRKLGSRPGEPLFKITSNHPLRGHKHSIHEGGIRVPAVVRWPEVVPGGSTCDVPVTTVDFYPTFLELAGQAGDTDWREQVLDGVSLVPLLKGEQSLNRDVIFFHTPHYIQARDPNTGELWMRPASSVRQGDWKLIRWYGEGDALYNLRNDIGETRDLADERADVTARLSTMLDGWLNETGAVIPTPNPQYTGPH